MEEVLEPDDDMLSALAAQMGLSAPGTPPPARNEAAAKAGKDQKSYAQLT